MEQYTSSQAQEPCQQWLDLQNRSGSGIEHLNNMTSSCTPDQSYTAQDRGLSTYDASFAHEIAPRCDLDADQVQSLHAQSLLDNANLWYNTADVVDIMPYSTEQLEDSKQSWGLRGCVGQYPDTTPDVPDLDTTQSLSPKSLRIETPMGNSPVTPKASTSVSSMGKYWPQHSTAGLVAADTSLYHDVQPADTMGNSGHQIFGAGYGDYTQSQMKSDSSSQLLNTPGHGLPIPVSPDTAQCQSNFTRGHYDTVSPTWHGDDKRAMLRQQLQLQQTVSQTNYQPQQHFGLHSSAAVSSAQQDFQARRRTTFTRPVDEDDMRKVDDQILLEGKKRNLTYKEIAKQMSLKCAESTLRGRYRSLTKPRHHRVRRPRWMPVDVSIMI